MKYAIDKSKILLGYAGLHWEKTIVAELDSALNSWADLVPCHRKYLFSFVAARIY